MNEKPFSNSSGCIVRSQIRLASREIWSKIHFSFTMAAIFGNELLSNGFKKYRVEAALISNAAIFS
jgi:hypothetical protein